MGISITVLPVTFVFDSFEPVAEADSVYHKKTSDPFRMAMN